jgi:hypothetical protein
MHNFQAALEPGETICIDEYLKGKRHKYGIKVFKLCCNGGYTYNTEMYASKNLEIQKTTPSRVVIKLSEPLLDCGRTMVTDNLYTSLAFAEELLNRQTHH